MPVAVNIPGYAEPVNFPDTMSTEDITAAAKKLHEDRRAEAAANMAKQPGEAELQARAKSEPWTAGAMLDRAKAGASGIVEGTAAGLAAPAVMLYNAVRHPLDTAETVGTAAAGAGIAATHALAHPQETYESAKAAAPGARDAVLKFAADPTNIGRATGAVESTLLLPPLANAARRTELGQAALETAEKAPVLGHLVKRVVPSNATMDKQFQTAMKFKDTQFAGDSAHAARMARRSVVPLADATATSPVRDAMTVEKRNAYGALPGQTDAEYVRSLVVPTSEAAASSARSAGVLPPSHRTPVVSNAGPAALADPRAALMDAIREKVVPLADDSARSLHTMEAPKTVSRAYAGEGAPNVPAAQLPNLYDGPEAAAEISHPGAQDYINREYAANHSHALDVLGDQVRVPADLEVVDNGGQPLMNASGESSASAEALSRQSGMKARGEEFVVKKGNTIRKLVGPDAVDYTPQPGEVFGVRDKEGNFRPLSQGDIKHGLTGNRGAGAMPIAMRRALFNRMTQGTK